MIVDPDFFDHWRTRMVVDALESDEKAPIYIMRLWAHCQTRKSERHAMPAAGLKAQCRYAGDAAAFEAALIEAGFISRDGDSIVVLGWAEQNASLLAAWANGSTGGRPPKPKQNPRVTTGKPMGNPSLTHGEPIANPSGTDKSREEKSREEAPSEEGVSRKRSSLARPADVSEQVWQDWCALRKRKRANVDETTLAGAREQADLAGVPLERFLAIWCRRGSQGLEAAWLKPEERGHSPPNRSEPAWRTEQRQRTQQAAPGVAVPSTDFFDAEARHVATDPVGGQDFREADPGLRPKLPSSVGGH